jgi:Ca2+-binding EF-hand superfamily protein
MRKVLFGGALAAALFSATIVLAQPAPTAPPKKARARGSFFTTNQNRADVPVHVQRMFTGLDVNRDGFVTRDEIASLQARFDDRMAKGAPKRAARMFDRLDTNHDGRITQAEVDAARSARAAAKGKTIKARRGPSALFLRADANKDGTITRAEFDAATASGKIKLRHANMRGSAIVRMFDTADSNKDGRVSLEEAQQAALVQFDAADANHDGVLTPEERRQASKSRRKKRGAG